MVLWRRMAGVVLVSVLWAGFALPSAKGPSAKADVFSPEIFTLENGMQVVAVPNPRVPVVTHMVWYKVGAANEPPGRSGVAHLLEHLMFKGTDQTAPGEFSQTVARIGGRENAFTSYDFTGYFQTVAKDELETVMRLEADRMTNLVLSPEQIETERQVVLEERRQRVESNPAALLAEQADAALYMNSSYRRPIIGWPFELKALSHEDIIAFYQRWYAPNNAILVVGGDIDAEELRPLAEKHYGAIPSADVPAEVVSKEPRQFAPRRVEMRDGRVEQPMWSRSYLAPSYLTGLAAGFAPDREAHVYPLQVAAQVLGGSATSDLYRRLVVEQPTAVSAGVSYDPSREGPSRFAVYASPRPGVSMDDLEAAVDEILDDVRENGVPASEVERAKQRMQADAVYARDGLGTGARVIGEALAIGLDVASVEAWPEHIAAVTPEQVNAALAYVLDPDRSVTSLLLPTEPKQAAER